MIYSELGDFDESRSEDPMISKIHNFLDLNREIAFTEVEIIGCLYPGHIARLGDTIAFSSAMLMSA